MALGPRPTRRALLVGLPAALLAGYTAARVHRVSPPRQTPQQIPSRRTPTTAAAERPPFVASGPGNRPAVALTWLSGRYDRAVYVIGTATGRLVHAIPVRAGPHGLRVWPQPGRYSLGHTGNTR